MFVCETSYTLGFYSVKIHSYLTNNMYIVCLDKKKLGSHKYPYKDNLCAVRCLTYNIYLTMYETNHTGFEMLTLNIAI